MEKNIAKTRDEGERVASTYAEIYFDDSFCEYEKRVHEPQEIFRQHEQPEDEWVSPSDLLIDVVHLKPPFTSKITRGKTHEGILAIGNDVLEKERAKFLILLNNLLEENDAAWMHILEQEKEAVTKKVRRIYEKIFVEKSKIMSKEIMIFYESTLQELEKHLRAQVKNVLISAHANIISDLNTQIKQKLEKERKILEEILQNRYLSEVHKIKKYYKLLLQNEINRNNKLVNKVLAERNDALRAFYRQVECETITSTMYVMCTERKKCRIKQFLLENYQAAEIVEKIEKLKERQEILKSFKEREVGISDINAEWEEKIKKVLELFLKFISFSLKLLPEQTTFLLDLEKMVILQLNEMIKVPKKVSSLLIDVDYLQNIFKFEEQEMPEPVCDKEPFVVEGDPSDVPPPRYGSRETLASDVDLPFIRLQRQFLYAKCHKYEELKAFLESQRCKCHDQQFKPPLQTPSPSSETPQSVKPSTSHESESSNELFLVDDYGRLNDCPVRQCKDWTKRFSFPYLTSYLDFNEDNLRRVEAILIGVPKREPSPELINPKDLAYQELPFSATKELYRTTETQYSSQEDLQTSALKCPCVDEIGVKQKESHYRMQESPSKMLNEILMKRKTSLSRLIQQKPNLLKMFTDECFDFQF